jgi:hypothetical protein
MGVLEIQCHHLFPCFINLHLVTSRLFVVMMIQFALRCSSASGILQVIYKNESSTYIVVPRNTMQHLFNILTLLFSQQRDWHLMEFVSYSNCVCTLSSLPAVHIWFSESQKTASYQKRKRKENSDIIFAGSLTKSNSTMLQTWLLQVSNSFVEPRSVFDIQCVWFWRFGQFDP